MVETDPNSCQTAATDDDACQTFQSFRQFLEFMGRRHMLEVLFEIGKAPSQRFTVLQQAVGITPKTLTSRLHDLVELGLVERRAFNEIPPRVEYSLTQKGSAIGPVFQALLKWLQENAPGAQPSAFAGER